MKKYIMSALIVASTSTFASEYNCKATLNSGEKVKHAKLNKISDKVNIISIGSFQFNATQTDDETIVLSVFNRAKREQAATATTFVPKENKPSNLSLRLADGAALIECMVK